MTVPNTTNPNCATQAIESGSPITGVSQRVETAPREPNWIAVLGPATGAIAIGCAIGNAFSTFASLIGAAVGAILSFTFTHRYYNR